MQIKYTKPLQGPTFLQAVFCLKGVYMFGKAPGKNAGEMKFVVAFRINDDVTKQLIQRVIDSGYQPEQIARYALKKYLNELSHAEV